jgi:hypothetical protein
MSLGRREFLVKSAVTGAALAAGRTLCASAAEEGRAAGRQWEEADLRKLCGAACGADPTEDALGPCSYEGRC